MDSRFCGELWFLDNVLIDKLGSDMAIRSWIGPEKEIKTSLLIKFLK